MELRISEADIAGRLAEDNGWWHPDKKGQVPFRSLPRRDYFQGFLALASTPVQRAVILMGPRRVGKTVMLHQLIGHLLDEGVPGGNILYCSVDTPTYNGLSLEKILEIFAGQVENDESRGRWVIFDEIQYLKDWEIHLKILVDRFPETKFIASGSAAAALRLKSRESGAGRFTEFILPPLTFAEYLRFSGVEESLIAYGGEDEHGLPQYSSPDIEELNREYIKYLNYGGYPEAVMQPHIREQAGRFLGKDIIDKILLKDLPNLYGIDNIAELNRLFTMIAYHSGQEINLDSLATSSNVSKNTIVRYLEYLESSFLIWRVHKLDENGRTFKRVRNFKAYLTNPSMRASLFAPMTEDDPALGHMVETGIFAQWCHTQGKEDLHYARWKDGEVDMVCLDRSLKPSWAVEIKWSDSYGDRAGRLKALADFAKRMKLTFGITLTTRTLSSIESVAGVDIQREPSSLYCYTVGKNLLKGKRF